MNTIRLGFLIVPLLFSAAMADTGKWKSAERDGRLEVRDGDAVVFAWQSTPLAQPKGGAKFASSAFLHPLRTPSGFEWTTIQPDDHKHHFGLWWPWKYIEVNGKKYNCWEIQAGQGRHVARGAKSIPADAGALAWEFSNVTEILEPGAQPQAVIQENAQVVLAASGTDAQTIDISIQQKVTGQPVTITAYRYSGFSWRGPVSWNKDNSRLTTSEGLGREEANGKPARWCVVSGPTPSGRTSVLLMSAAAVVAHSPELLRVWDSKAQNGMPFVNFNPVMQKPLPLDDAHPAVSNRKYRVIAADREIDATAAEAEWRKWMHK